MSLLLKALRTGAVVLGFLVVIIGAMLLLAFVDGMHSRDVRDKFVSSIEGTVISQSYVNYHLQYIYWRDSSGSYFKTTIEGNDTFTEPVEYRSVESK